MLVLEVGKQKEGARGKVTNVIDHYFHVASESIVKGETVLEVSQLRGGVGLGERFLFFRTAFHNRAASGL